MALRHFLTLTLLFINTLYSNPSDFRSCQLKYQVSSFNIFNTQALVLKNNVAVFYSKEAMGVNEHNVSLTNPSVKLLKRDVYLGLNLVSINKTYKHPFAFYTNHPKQLATLNAKSIKEARVLKEQNGLNQLGELSSLGEKNSFIMGSCCGLLGLSTGKGFISKDYLEHFINTSEVVYSDVGIRVGDDKGVRVVEVNPFFKDSPFLLDDIILYMDKKKSISAAQVSRDILFSLPGSKHYFLILRNGVKQSLNAVYSKRLSGGLIPDSFFDLFGLELDEKLFVKKDSPRYEIKNGDKLLFVMGKEVKSLKEIRHTLSMEKTSKNKLVVLLFKRDGFEFFIHFNKPSNSQ